MKASSRRSVPLRPLLRVYLDAGLPAIEDLVQLPGLGSRFQAVLSARRTLLCDGFLDGAGEEPFRAAILRFHGDCMAGAVPGPEVGERARIVRHGLAHLLRCPDHLARKLDRCLAPDGSYCVPGLGPAFWSALLQALDPRENAGWTPAIEAGLKRLGLARWRPHHRPGRVYTAIQHAYRRIRNEAPTLTALHVEHFLTLVASMPGRDLFAQRKPLEHGDSLLAELEPKPFGGFCADTFCFLADLRAHNRRDWMDSQRERYRYAVREPLVELCQVLAERYVEPVLHREHGWRLETEARSGRALTSICKNDYGRSVPYYTALWIAFCGQGPAGKRDGVQFFVRLDSEGLNYGLCVGRSNQVGGDRFRRNLEEHGALLWHALRESGTLSQCRFGDSENLIAARRLSEPEELRTWITARSPIVLRQLPPDSALPRSEELVGEILLTFDRLLPLYAWAAEADPLPALERWAPRWGVAAAQGAVPRPYRESDFERATLLGNDWLARARSLLALKRQLILQGVPGTGKTHVARQLARLLTGGRDEAVRLVQFHPAYSYEEFVEGIKPRSVEVEGRHEVTYPVEDGLLTTFAARAAEHPGEPHVLVIDEINRGNLPRIFGELLYLLEYREQEVVLPYSKRPFRLPANLYVVGTMNAADRSVALIDQALRRRFSFLDMPPDAEVLGGWFQSHPPASAAFAELVVQLLRRLNDRLRGDLGPLCQIGHSYFMVEGLDEARLEMVWQHHVGPLIAEYFASQPERAERYELHRLLRPEGGKPRPRRRRPAKAL